MKKQEKILPGIEGSEISITIDANWFDNNETLPEPELEKVSDIFEIILKTVLFGVYQVVWESKLLAEPYDEGDGYYSYKCRLVQKKWKLFGIVIRTEEGNFNADYKLITWRILKQLFSKIYKRIKLC